MKAFSKKILSLLIIIMLLISSFSYSMSMHWCGGEIAEFAFFNNALEGCGMEEAMPSACHENKEEIHEESCCKDQHLLIEGQTHQTKLNQSKNTSFQEDYSFLAHFAKAYSLVINNNNSNADNSFLSAKYHHYKPPVADKDIPVLLQVFLI